MVVHHWSDDGMVLYHRRSLIRIFIQMRQSHNQKIPTFGPMKSARVRSNPMVANSVRRLGSDEQSGTKGQRLLILVQRRRPVYQMVKKTAVMVPAIAAGCHSWGKSGLNEKEASTCFHPRKASTARTASLQPSMLSRTEKE